MHERSKGISSVFYSLPCPSFSSLPFVQLLRISQRHALYTALHYTTLHYTTLHYTTLHYTVLHYTTLHCTTLHYTTLHYTALHYITLHYTALHYTTLHYTTLHYTTPHHITSHHILFTTSCYTVLTGEAVAVLASWWLSVWSEDRDGRSPWSVARREHRIYVAIVHFSTPPSLRLHFAI